MEFKINVVKSNRKTFSLEIKPNLEIICRAPYSAAENEINDFLKNHKLWLEKNLKKARERISNESEIQKLSREELDNLKLRAKEYIPQRVEFFANQMKVKYGTVTIRTQKTRWGSCSAEGNLNFNCLLMLTDLDIIDYVVVHELCHIKELNHSKEFWSEVEKALPDYRKRRERLKNIGTGIIKKADKQNI